jgi:hypothetical protein
MKSKTNPKEKRPEEDPMSDIYWLKRLAPRRKRIWVGERGRQVRVWSFVDDLAEVVAGFYDYDRGTLRNVATLWGLYYMVKNGKLPKNKEDVFRLYRFVYHNIFYMLSVYASAYHVSGPGIDFDTALKIVHEQINKEKKELKELNIEDKIQKEKAENEPKEGDANGTG